MKRRKLFRLLAALTAIVLVAGMFAACSKDDDNDGKKENPGGNIIDPNVPVLSNITYEMAPDAVLVPEATAKEISNVDTLGHKFTLPLSADEPQVGQTLIINTPSKQLHDGLLAKVTGVEETGSGYVVSYRDAELKDAFKDINIPEQYIPLNSLVEHVYDADGNEISFSRGEVDDTRASGEINYPIVLPEHGWKLGKDIELTPKMTIDVAMRYVFTFADYEVDYISVLLDADVTVGADLSLTVKEFKGWQKKLHLFTCVCGAIPIGPVVLTPSIDVYGVVKADGKISLEASISYTRTLHAKFMYQKGYDIDGNCELDPEADDALQFSFGPKFEGNFYYGLAMGGNIGVFGKTLAVRARLNVMKKESVSAKLDLVEMVKNEGLASLIPLAIPSVGASLCLGSSALDALGWNRMAYTDFDYSQALVYQLGFDLTLLGHDVKSKDLPEFSSPIDSRKIFPQFDINTNKFIDITKDGDATLTLHLREKSLLGSLAEYRAEWTRLGAPKGEGPIVAYFDQTGAKTFLEADKKGEGFDIYSKTKLNKDDTYTLVVYMKLLGIDFEIFKVEPTADEVAAVIVTGSLQASSPTYEEGEPRELDPLCVTMPNYPMIKTVRNGNKLHVQCNKLKEVGEDQYIVDSDIMVSFDIDDVTAIHSGKAKIQNLKIDNHFDLNFLGKSSDIFKLNVASDLSIVEMAPGEGEEDEDITDLGIDAKYAKAWTITQGGGLKFSLFDYTYKEWFYKWDRELREDVLDHIDEHVFTLTPNPANYITVAVAFK